MAQWVTRPRADGGVGIQIKWRLDGRWQSETFTQARLAAEFRTAVEQAGHRWPEGWVKGEGWAPELRRPWRCRSPTLPRHAQQVQREETRPDRWTRGAPDRDVSPKL